MPSALPSDDCQRPGDGYLATKPVASNGLSKLMQATSDQSPLTAGMRKSPDAGMKAPKANNPQVSR